MARRVEPGPDGAPLAIKTADGEHQLQKIRAERAVLETLWVPGLVEVVDGAPDELRTRYVGERTLGSALIDDPAVVAAVVAAVAQTVSDLHDLGVSHGRLTPDHVLLDECGRPVLCGLSNPGLTHSLSTIVGPDAAPFNPDADSRALGAMLEDLVLRLPVPDGRRRSRNAATQRTQLRSIAAAAGRRVGLLRADEVAAALAAFSGRAGLPVRPTGPPPLPMHGCAQIPPPPPLPARPHQGPPTLPAAPPLPPTTSAPQPQPAAPAPPDLTHAPTVSPTTLPSPPALPPQVNLPSPPPLPPQAAAGPEPEPALPKPEPAPPKPEPESEPEPEPLAASVDAAETLPPLDLPPPKVETRVPDLIGSVDSSDEHATRDFGPRRITRAAEGTASKRRLPLPLVVAAAAAVLVGAGTTAAVLVLGSSDSQASAGPAATSAPEARPASAALSAPTTALVPVPAPPTSQPPPAAPAPPAAPTTTAAPPCPTGYGEATAQGIPSHCAVTVTENRVQLGDLRWVVGAAGDRVVVGDAGCDGRLDVVVARVGTGEVFLFNGWAAPGDAVSAQPVTAVPGLTALRWEGGPCGALILEGGTTASTIPAKTLGGTR